MTCRHPLWGDPDARLRCISPAGHATGHVYRAATGSDVPDRHTETCEDGQ